LNRAALLRRRHNHGRAALMSGGRPIRLLRSARRCHGALLSLLCWMIAFSAQAHDRHDVSARLEIGGDAWELRLPYDIPALMTGGIPFHADPADSAGRLAALSPDERARAASQAARFFLINLRFEIDGRRVTPSIDLPGFEDGPLGRLGDPESVPFARFGGAIPVGARSLAMSPGRSLGTMGLIVIWTGHPGAERLTIPFGGMSEPISIAPPPPPDPRAGVVARYFLRGARDAFLSGAGPLLLALALWLLTSRWRDFASQMAAFAAGSTLTLMLAGTGYLHVPPEVIGLLVPLAIVAAAGENLLARRMHVGRPVRVFVYGLFFGLHFATSLTGAGLPRLRAASALLGFELGLLSGLTAAILVIALASARLRGRPGYPRRMALPASAIVALAGVALALRFVLNEL
jgi:hypothetical protein